MKLSACNQTKDTVVEVRKGGTTARVRIDIGNGLTITSSITDEAGEDLGIGGWRRGDRRHQGFRRDSGEIAPMRINRYPQAGRAVSTGALWLLAAIAVALFLLPGGPVTAADQSAPGDATASGSGIMLDGKVKHPQKLTVDALHKFPAERVDVSFQTAHGMEKSSYTGVLLWTLLGQAGGIDDPAKGAELRHTISITGRDGYLVVISTGEIAPDFDGKPAMIAYERDGQDLGATGLRIVMPGDKHGGRYVRDVAEIEVK